MDLKAFVAETLRQIMDGVKEAKDYGSSIGGEVNPSMPPSGAGDIKERVYRHTPTGKMFAQDVSFDVAVTTGEEKHREGGAKLAVAMFSGGGKLQSGTTNSSISRVQFTVPVLLP